MSGAEEVNTVDNIYATEYVDYGACGDPLDVESQEPIHAGQAGPGGYARLVGRDGDVNIGMSDTRRRRILGTLSYGFHTLIGMRAWKLIALFFTTYIFTFMFFGCIVYLTQISGKAEYRGVDNYFDAVIFVGYTMTTVGFGNQYPHAADASIVPLLTVLLSLLLDAFWLGIIFARISSPRPLRHTILFSKYAVVNMQPGDVHNTLRFRFINLRVNYPWIDLVVTLRLATWDPLKQAMRMRRLELSNECEPFMDIPWTVEHEITPESPLMLLLAQPDSFSGQRGEIIIELDGQDPLTGNCMKTRFSYIADEIYRDHELVNILTLGGKNNMEYRADLTQFHAIKPMGGTPRNTPRINPNSPRGPRPGTPRGGAADRLRKSQEVCGIEEPLLKKKEQPATAEEEQVVRGMRPITEEQPKPDLPPQV